MIRKPHSVIVFTAALLLSCSGESTFTGSNGTGSGSQTTSFVKLDSWSIDSSATNPGQGTTVNVFAGEFVEDDAGYPDLVVLTTNGAYLYKNQIANDAVGWDATTGRINGTEAAYQAGLVIDIDDDGNLDDLVLLRETPRRVDLFRSNDNGSFGSVESLVTAGDANWVAGARKKNANLDSFNFFIADDDGNHRSFEITDNEIIGLVNQTSTVSIAVRVLASDFNADGFVDFVLIPQSGTEQIDFFRNDSDESYDRSFSVITRNNANNIITTELADLNSDGKIDLILATTTGVEVYSNQTEDEATTLNFRRESALSFSGTDVDGVTWIVAQDFTEDSIVDLVLVREGQEPLFFAGSDGDFIYNNITDVAFESSDLSDTVTRAYAVDIDLDRVMDLVMVSDSGDIDVFFNQEDDSSDAD